MKETRQLKIKLISYTDEEVVKYVKEYSEIISNEVFRVLMTELENRPQLKNIIDIQTIIESRNRKFKDNLPKFLASNIKDLKTVDDLTHLLEKQFVEESEFKNILKISVDKLSEMENKNEKDKKNSILIILGGILLALPLYNSTTGGFSNYIFCGVIFFGVYKLLGVKNTIEYQNLRENIRNSIK